MQHTATCCNTLQRTATHYYTHQAEEVVPVQSKLKAKLQCTASHCYTLQHCNTLHHTPVEEVVPVYEFESQGGTATHCNTLHHTATHFGIHQVEEVVPVYSKLKAELHEKAAAAAIKASAAAAVAVAVSGE